MMRRVVETWAADAAAFAIVLHEQDPGWGSNTFSLAGGHVVLWGAGLYVNRALGVGLDAPVTPADFDLLEARTAAVGVAAAIEVSPSTHPGVHRAACARGYVVGSTVVALRRDLSDVAALPIDASIVIEPAADRLRTWQETSAPDGDTKRHRHDARVTRSPLRPRRSTGTGSCSPAMPSTAARWVARVSRCATVSQRSAGCRRSRRNDDAVSRPP